ncbi:MAG: PEP-utilizing enzyme [Candidatus Campbellbacteria bacterium]|nr:PEP-utilizing enzyme [Candidatus Campbellbacteria bacterium]
MRLHSLSKISRRRDVCNKGYCLQKIKIAGHNVASGFIVPTKYPLEQMQEKVLKEFDQLGTDKVIVRSSFSSEDEKTRSYAGVFNSITNVGRSKLISKIKEVVGGRDGMAVVIQEMKKPDISGVMFTDNGRGDVRIELAKGGVSRIVSGKTTPEVCEIVRNRVIYDGKLISPKKISRLKRAGDNLQKLFGCPQDVEWAFIGDKLYIFQSRPITKFPNKMYVLEEVREYADLFILDHHLLKSMNEFLEKEFNGFYLKSCVLKYNPKKKMITKYIDQKEFKAYIGLVISRAKEDKRWLHKILYKDMKNMILENKDYLDKKRLVTNKSEFLRYMRVVEKFTPLYSLTHSFALNPEVGKRENKMAIKHRKFLEKYSDVDMDIVAPFIQSLKNNQRKALMTSTLDMFKENKTKEMKKTMYFIDGSIVSSKDVQRHLKKLNMSFEKQNIKGVKVLHGNPIYPKDVKGRVCILRSVRDMKKFHKGSILVASSFGPEYYKLVEESNGVVVENGGELSHAAIHAREWKKSCVIGVKNAKNILKDGQMISVTKTGKIFIH